MRLLLLSTVMMSLMPPVFGSAIAQPGGWALFATAAFAAETGVAEPSADGSDRKKMSSRHGRSKGKESGAALKEAEARVTALEKEKQRLAREVAAAAGREKELLEIIELQKKGTGYALAEELRRELLSVSAKLREKIELLAAAVSERDTAGEQLRQAARERDEAREALGDAGRRMPEVRDVTMVLREREKYQKEQNEYIEKLKTEIAGLTERVREQERLLAAAGQPAGAAAVPSVDIQPHEPPIVRIGEDSFSLRQIVEETLIASRVMEKLGEAQPPWKKGQAYEDFIIEQVLFARARRAGILATADTGIVAAQHHFDQKELAYLGKYRTVALYVSQQRTARTPAEHDLRQWYETHRAEFRVRDRQKQLVAVMLGYAPEEEIEDGLLASDIREELVNGRTAESIAEAYKGRVQVQAVALGDLPLWLREKAQVLATGQTSNILSSEDRYIILRAVGETEAEYRAFDDVRDEVKARIAAVHNAKGDDLGAWLEEARREAVELQ